VQIMKTLRQLAKSLNKTIVVIIHDINFASCYSDDIIALKDGEMVKASTKDEVIQEDTLKTLYDIDVKIEDIRGQRICVYFDEEKAEYELSILQSVYNEMVVNEGSDATATLFILKGILKW